LHVWENWGDPFSKYYKIWDRQYWNEFWDNCPYTQKQIYMALRNVHYCVKKGTYERRFISSDPCKFIQGGMIDRVLSDEMRWEYETNHHGDPNLGKLRDD
jgi:hypothetical protein